MIAEKFGKNKSLKKAGRLSHNIIALLFLFVPMVLLGQALFSYGATGIALANESVANKRLAETRVHSQKGILFEEGVVSLTFDDGWKSVATNAAPIMAQYNIASTQYIIANSIGAPGYMSVGQLKALKIAGHEIASHTASHLALADQDGSTIDYEYTESKKRLLDMKLIEKGAPVDFAYPYGSRSAETDTVGATMYQTLRGAKSGLNDGFQPKDLNLRESFSPKSTFIGMTIDHKTKLSEVRKAIQYAKANNGWLVMNFHQIDDEGTDFSVSTKTFTDILHIIMEENIKTMTVKDAMETYKEKK